MHARIAVFVLLTLIGIGATASTSAGQVQASSRPHLLLKGAPFDGDDSLVTTQEWFGLYRIPKVGYELRRAVVRIEHVHNGCAATKIVTEDSLTPLLLVSGISSLHPGPVDTVFSGYRFLYPGEDVSWLLGTRWYNVRALGAATEVPANIMFSGYELRLGTDENAYSTRQTVVRLDFSLEGPPRILWAGDLDGDGRLDVLLQLPGGGYSRDTRLYLSSVARAPNLIREAGRFHVADC